MPASELLTAAIEPYHAASSSSAITSCYSNNPLDYVSVGISKTIREELEVPASNEIKFNRAKAMVNRTRNAIPTVTPVNKYPPAGYPNLDFSYGSWRRAVPFRRSQRSKDIPELGGYISSASITFQPAQVRVLGN